MPDKSSPLWWLFAALGAAAFIAAMLPGMVNARQKIVVALAPVPPLLVLLGLATASEGPSPTGSPSTAPSSSPEPSRSWAAETPCAPS
ncbi:hypothetical protein ACFQ7M_38045 [Streptomyces massasporeus]